MDSLFYGESERAFFSYTDINSVRKLTRPIYPRPYYAALGDSKIKYPPKENGEIRILSMDVATAGGSKNDASAISMLQILPTNNAQYVRNLVFIETLDGGHGQDQAIRVRQLYDDLDADYVALDTNGGNAPPYGDIWSGAREKSGTLRWESEWKASSKIEVTRNAYGMNLLCRI